MSLRGLSFNTPTTLGSDLSANVVVVGDGFVASWAIWPVMAHDCAGVAFFHLTVVVIVFLVVFFLYPIVSGKASPRMRQRANANGAGGDETEPLAFLSLKGAQRGF